ncbi:thiopeptide-type bacteriocin biosynthesis protein [Aquimarina sp. W85]|uniref:thiopeptide-type bacteriocin biosynthesis protein n=1 Tax=Aquimarina rhodophyticola TaxID=3342246 RepID=UPI003670DA6A
MGLKRTHIIGDEWLYYKLYCGVRTSDLLLINAIKPLVHKLLKDKLIDSWFFIRYKDPDYHIRIRFHLIDTKDENIGAVINAINAALKPYLAQHSIYKIQTDTYNREIERYGCQNIENSETIFFYSSELLLSALEHFKNDESYFLFVLSAIDQFLTNFNLDLVQKIDFTKANMLAFKKEFEADKKLNKQLDKKYANLRSKIHDAIDKKDSDYKIFKTILSHPKFCNQRIIQQVITVKTTYAMDVSLEELLSSYIHMHVNRAFRSQQRFYELVCYDLLYKYYKAKSYKIA